MKHKMKKTDFFKKTIFLLGLLFAGFDCFAGIKFGDADINQNDEILFTVRQEFPENIFSIQQILQTCQSMQFHSGFLPEGFFHRSKAPSAPESMKPSPEFH